MKKDVKCLLSALVFAGISWGGYGIASAAGEAVYELNPVVVTATRTEKADIDVPANVTVVTAKKIEEAGYKNAFDAIQSQVGVESTGYGDAGQDFGFSSGRTVVRGYDRGTLVMVNGIPMNLKNYNSLAGIPKDMIEKIEIVKGAAGTLYGAEAMGGVINIMTKTPQDGKETVTLKGTVGNYYNDYGATYAGPNLIVSLQREYSDLINHSNAYPVGSKTNWWVGKGQSNRATVAAKLSEEVGFNLMYQEGNITRGSFTNDVTVGSKKVPYNYRFDDKRATAGMTYTGKENGIKAIVGYNYRKADGFDRAKNEPVSSSAELSSYITDVQKTWELGKDTLIAGYTFKREDYEGLVKKANKAHRLNHGFYLSYTDEFSPKFSATLGLRAEIIKDPVSDQNVFNPQFQTLYKFNDNTSWYVDIGRGFQMPTVDSYYGKKAASDTLKPEKGWTYETGIKHNFSESQSLKFSVYHMDFKNKIGWSAKDPDTGLQYAINKGNFRNTGVEVTYDQVVNNHWDYSLGFSYSNPEVNDPTGKKGWVQDSARLDGVASVTYRTDKIRSTLSWKYLGDREDYTGSSKPKTSDPQTPSLSRVTWNTIYDVTPNDTLSLTLNNLFDHENYANRYGNLELPYNWRLSYSHKF